MPASGFKDYNMGEGGTLTYRIAWVYERFDYLIHRPIGEQIFGLGLISDSQPIVNKKYNFMIGLRDESTGETYQLYTPDISYGNLLSRHGFVGSIIYLCMLVNFAIFLYKDRKANAFTIVCSAMIIMLFVGSIFQFNCHNQFIFRIVGQRKVTDQLKKRGICPGVDNLQAAGYIEIICRLIDVVVHLACFSTGAQADRPK